MNIHFPLRICRKNVSCSSDKYVRCPSTPHPWYVPFQVYTNETENTQRHDSIDQNVHSNKRQNAIPRMDSPHKPGQMPTEVRYGIKKYRTHQDLRITHKQTIVK